VKRHEEKRVLVSRSSRFGTAGSPIDGEKCPEKKEKEDKIPRRLHNGKLYEETTSPENGMQKKAQKKRFELLASLAPPPEAGTYRGGAGAERGFNNLEEKQRKREKPKQAAKRRRQTKVQKPGKVGAPTRLDAMGKRTGS